MAVKASCLVGSCLVAIEMKWMHSLAGLSAGDLQQQRDSWLVVDTWLTWQHCDLEHIPFNVLAVCTLKLAVLSFFAEGLLLSSLL